MAPFAPPRPSAYTNPMRVILREPLGAVSAQDRDDAKVALSVIDRFQHRPDGKLVQIKETTDATRTPLYGTTQATLNRTG
jgi:hypothetical protein